MLSRLCIIKSILSVIYRNKFCVIKILIIALNDTFRSGYDEEYRRISDESIIYDSISKILLR